MPHSESSIGQRSRPAGRTRAGTAVETSVQGVVISHPERLLYDDPPISKLDLARYYEAIGDYLMPHLLGRRLALLRCPDGASGECFFQKHISGSLPEGVDLDGDMVVVRGLAGVISLVQRGVIEFHTWGARTSRPEQPDRLTFDLDPDPALAWKVVADAAALTRRVLGELGLASFLKTTGGKGLHIVVPLRPSADWDAARTFCKGVAQRLEAELPQVFVANMSKARRGGHIFVDYLRNSDGATAVAAFSARARPGAPVSMPVSWNVLERRADPRGDAYNVVNALKQVKKWGAGAAPWAGYDDARIALGAGIRGKVAVT